MPNSRWVVLAVCITALAPGVAHAQSAVRGHLIDDATLSPVGGATITALVGETRSVQAVTRDDGSFFLTLDAWGAYRLEAERIGYGTTTSQVFQVEAGDTVTVEFRVLADAVLMLPLVVTARSNRGRNVFQRRMEDWGKGIFVTPDMIDSIRPRHPADVLRNQEDIWLSWSWYRDNETLATGSYPNVRTFQGSGCLSYMIDGRPIYRPRWARGPVWMNYPMDMLQGDDLVAVEIYRSIGEVPPDIRNAAEEIFNGEPPPGVSRLDGSLAARVQQDFIEHPCGIVNFWTASGW